MIASMRDASIGLGAFALAVAGAAPGLHWFDSGELKRLVDALDKESGRSDGASGEGGAISRFFADLYHHEFQEASEKGQDT